MVEVIFMRFVKLLDKLVLNTASAEGFIDFSRLQFSVGLIQPSRKRRRLDAELRGEQHVWTSW